LPERIYLDTNVYCRPLDDQSKRRIRAEAKAFYKIAELSEKGAIQVISSDYVKFELERIWDTLKRNDVKGFEATLSTFNVSTSKGIISLALSFVRNCKIGDLDALHLAAACIGDVTFFLTCDDEVISHAFCIEALASEKGYKLKVRNPINYLKDRRSVKK
jgi:hypothetical protein